MNNTFGERLRELRKKRRMSRDDLGDVLGVSGVAITAYETGKRNPRKEIIDHICEYFDVRYDWLTGTSEFMTDDDYIRVLVETQGEAYAEEQEGRYIGKDEMDLVKAYRELSPADRKTATDFILYLKKKP